MITDYQNLLNIASKQIQWVLDKALPDIVLSKQSITLDSDNLTDTFTISSNSDGNLSVSSSDDSIATVSLSGNTAIVEALSDGSTTITVNVTESSNYISNTKTLSVNVQLVSTTLNDNSWNTIKVKAQSGEASSLWNVGDTKEVILTGDTTMYNYTGTEYKSVTKSFNDYSCYATILGFDHNASLETNGEHSIHFILAKDSTRKDICFYHYCINNSRTSPGGWNGSMMKQTTMTEFKNLLSADLQSVLKTVTKYTHNNVAGYSNANANSVTATTEELFLLSEFEVQGTITHANKYEQYKQAQYAYYKNGNSKVRYRDDIDGTVWYWYTRSAYCSSDYAGSWCCVKKEDGSSCMGWTDGGIAIAPAFVV